MGHSLETKGLQPHLQSPKQSPMSHYFSKSSGASTASGVGRWIK